MALARPQTPSWRLQLANFVVSQAAWFAAVLGAAHHQPVAGTLCVLVAIGWHLAVSPGPAREAGLMLVASLVGTLIETGVVWQGHVAYPSGQPVAWLPPYWLVALWALFAVALNVTLRWLRGRPWLAAGLGAVSGPLAFAAGVRLGGAQFLDAVAALLTLALAWSIALPLLVACAKRLDGVSFEERAYD